MHTKWSSTSYMQSRCQRIDEILSEKHWLEIRAAYTLWHKVSPLPPLPNHSLSPYTRLFLKWALTRLQASGLTESITRIEVAHHYTSDTHCQASLTVTCNTTHFPTLGVVHWASQWGRPQHWYLKGLMPPRIRKKDGRRMKFCEDKYSHHRNSSTNRTRHYFCMMTANVNKE